MKNNFSQAVEAEAVAIEADDVAVSATKSVITNETVSPKP